MHLSQFTFLMIYFLATLCFYWDYEHYTLSYDEYCNVYEGDGDIDSLFPNCCFYDNSKI
jgi:hypothetical protein